MGKLTYKGLVPRDDPMFSTGPEVFSRLGSSESSSSSQRSTSGATPVESSSATDPMQPAVDAIEEWGRITFGGRADAGGLDLHRGLAKSREFFAIMKGQR